MADQANVSFSQGCPSCMPNSNAPNKANEDFFIREGYQAYFLGLMNNTLVVSCCKQAVAMAVAMEKCIPS